MICPNCQNDQSITEQNYGALYTCQSCQAVYFINFEGQPEFSGIEAESIVTSNEPILSYDGAFNEVAQDISDYGNTETQIAHLNYELNISGLDSAEIMKKFKEAIEDSRFGWDTNELMRKIQQGEIKFEKLNPVKAYILAKRLQFLDVEKIWKQNAV